MYTNSFFISTCLQSLIYGRDRAQVRYVTYQNYDEEE